jgi:hypothetical protein
MIVATGHSEDPDSADAIDEALDRCAETLGERTPQAGLLFSGIDHDHQALLDGVQARYPDLQLIGCATHGELSSDGFAEESVLLMLLHSERIRFGAGVGEGVRADPEVAGRDAVETARRGLSEPVRLCVTVPEGLGIDINAVLGGMRPLLDGDTVICGGLAADDAHVEQTFQFCNGYVYTDAVPVLLAAGPLRVATGVASGLRPMGEDHRVTRAEGPVVHEIDGRPPREVWEHYYGTSTLQGYRNAMAIYPDERERSEEFYLCSPAHFHEDGSMTTFTPVLPGARMRFAEATRDSVLSGAKTSAATARAGYRNASPDAALVFSCSARQLLLGTRVGEEASLLREQIGTELPAIGFYTYGEICPLAGSTTPFSHNTTFVTVLFGEDHDPVMP